MLFQIRNSLSQFSQFPNALASRFQIFGFFRVGSRIFFFFFFKKASICTFSKLSIVPFFNINFRTDRITNFSQIFEFLILNYPPIRPIFISKFSNFRSILQRKKRKKKTTYANFSLCRWFPLEERKQKNRSPLRVADADIPVSRDFGARWRSRYGKEGRKGTR